MKSKVALRQGALGSIHCDGSVGTDAFLGARNLSWVADWARALGNTYLVDGFGSARSRMLQCEAVISWKRCADRWGDIDRVSGAGENKTRRTGDGVSWVEAEGRRTRDEGRPRATGWSGWIGSRLEMRGKRGIRRG